uniref:Chloroquine resistance transporter n=1 Tax=Babesia duncani TaxID=323732 RepID=A0A3G3LPG4_9APIC|nr:chloroquine resistance transporter [Babesia duncani]
MDVLTTIYYKRLLDSSTNYALFTMEILMLFFVLAFGLIYIICYFAIPEYMKRTVPMKPLVLLGILDVISNSLSTIGSTYSSGYMMVLLGQIGIPLTIIACKVILSKTYHSFQYIGSAFIFGFVVFQELAHDDSANKNSIKYNLIYMAACIPDAVSSAIKTMLYGSGTMNMVKYQFYVISMQFIISIPMQLIIMAIRQGTDALGTKIWELISNGSLCIFSAINTITDQCGIDEKIRCDECEEAFKLLCYYLIFNIIIRIAYIFIMMQSSATLVFLLGTMKIPLSSLAFSSKKISGSSSVNFNFMDIICFLGICFGLYLYGYGSTLQSPEEDDNSNQNQLSTPLIENELR